jgi:hypothetical protein
MVITPSPGLAIAALLASGVGNGLRVPPIVGVTTTRIPPAMRAETLTVSSAVVLTGGFLALLVVGPALDGLGPEVVFGAIAGFQTLAAALALKLAYHRPEAVRLRGVEMTAP